MVNKGSRWNCLQLEVTWRSIPLMCARGLICWDAHPEWLLFSERTLLLSMPCTRYAIVADCRDLGSMSVGKHSVTLPSVHSPLQS